MITFSTRLESTSALVVYGHDLFFARVNAEGSFDRLDQNFKNVLLFGTIATLVLALYGTSSYSQSVEAKDKFLLKW